MKKITKILISITCLVLLTVFTTGCADKIDRKTLRKEQERMVEYAIQNYEDIKRIEFKDFEQNTSTRSWSSGAVINNEIYITYNSSGPATNTTNTTASTNTTSGGSTNTTNTTTP